MDAHRVPLGAVGTGLVAWAAVYPFVPGVTADVAWIHRFLLLAILVGVPLVLHAVRAPRGAAAKWERAAVLAQPGAALLAAVAAVLPAGTVAALLTLPWLATAGLLAVAGALRIAADRLRPRWGDLSLHAAYLFLPVGAFWWTVSRSGGEFMGFGDPIALLTGIHFHYTAFAALALATLLDRAGAAPRRFLGPLVVLGVVGTPVTAAGITLLHHGVPAGAWVAVAGAALVVAAFLILAVLNLAAALGNPSWGPARVLLALSGAAGLFGVPWGLLWAWDQATGQLGLSIALMVRVHGAVNAVGFVIPALVAWALLRPAATTDRTPSAGAERQSA